MSMLVSRGDVATPVSTNTHAAHGNRCGQDTKRVHHPIVGRVTTLMALINVVDPPNTVNCVGLNARVRLPRQCFAVLKSRHQNQNFPVYFSRSGLSRRESSDKAAQWVRVEDDEEAIGSSEHWPGPRRHAGKRVRMPTYEGVSLTCF